ncbi:hypothetical protein DSM112329_00550 [Paraconexibacter sp. AEG42_29]|uniref:Uncharacterized protein n=1 Tax=Paraconexibacter sp. AEG42_29 TaxID=2997339 RepID=A0AAU7AQG9_9ACTN
MVWTFIFLMVILKIPIALLGWIVWHAIRAVPELPVSETQEDNNGDDDGGIARPQHPRGPKPRPARRGPHRDAPPTPSPARSRKPATDRRRSTR